MRRRGFTLVELLVVIAIIALLMGILMPALARVRQLAFRMTCGTNLSGIGKAMLLYANDYQDELPRAGWRTSNWGPVTDWTGGNGQGGRVQAYGAESASATASISSCFYLLVKYTEVTPKSFICKGDSGTTEFKLSDLASPISNFELIDAWDFGPSTDSSKHCSYSMHFPFGLFALTVSSEPGFAVAADRNPFMDSPAGTMHNIADFKPDLTTIGAIGNGTADQAKVGNCLEHQGDGQNVMFLDTHVEFAKRSYCSIEDDNIYLVSQNQQTGSPVGVPPVGGTAPQILNRKDSVLVHDPLQWATGGASTRATRS